ncbi:MAG: response regulator [Alphaproteobacteria bacterium]
MKTRALFVDDEPLVLSGLRRLLRGLRHDWEMNFATSGPEALLLLEEQEFTVIVSDMRMPGMDGAALLNEVAMRHPAVARLVLSGHAELDAILRAVRPAHQFLAKPCDPKLLERALERIRQTRLDEQQRAICMKLGAHRRLPSPRAKIAQLRTALGAPTVDIEHVGDIVSADIGMSLQVLRLVNGAFFGPPTRTLDPRRAVSILGADIMRRLLVDVELFRGVECSCEQDDVSVVEVNRRVADLMGAVETSGDACDNGINAKTLAMMLHTGALAAIDIPEELDDQGERALGTLLLAYWGLDLEIADPRSEAWSPVAEVGGA